MTGTPSAPERATLSRELGEFLIELSIALHKHAMYPSGHPSLAPAAAGVVRRARQLMEERPSISLGVARNQLIIEGVATDPKHPVLAELAGRLHRHHLGAVTISRGVEPPEVEDMLRTLAVEADRTGSPLGLGPADALQAWPHIRLHPLTYERLELLEERSETPSAGSGDMGGGSRSAQLWIGLARAALAGQSLVEGDLPSTRPAVIAKAIDEHQAQGGEAYDQVIVGYLLQIAEELKAAGGAEAVELKRRTSRLIHEMHPETLKRLVEMGGDFAQRQKFVLDASHGMAVDAVLEIVRAAADTSHQTISHSMFRLLSKLAAHADRGSVVARPRAESELREQVQQLLAGWELDDPNPGAYGEALQRMAKAAPVFAVAAEQTHAAEDTRLVEMSLEVEMVGPLVWRAVDRLVAERKLGALFDVLEKGNGNATTQAIWERVATPEALHGLLEVEPIAFETVDRLVSRLGQAAATPMFDALAASESRATRRSLLERLARLGDAVGPLAVERLGDERWYVQRNMLGLLDELPHLPAGFSAVPFANHPDARVRWQAFKIQLKLPAEREAALRVALKDPDPRTLQTALVAALQGCPPVLLPAVAQIAVKRDLASDLRVLAVRVLARTASPTALDVFLTLTDGGKTWLGRPKLPPRSPELLAALQALATAWGSDRRSTAVLARAAVSPDAEVRAATDPGSAGE
ncbi:MAG TPA: hypothetical protein VFK78_05010 [Gemmatimonadales bacterium]|nr:hypothetical protein [Gemmatimonadales bacterium]